MNKLGVKKWLAFALVLVSAIACFTALGILPDKIKARTKGDIVEDSTYLNIGLDFEDGWHLIKTAEDYYTMTQYTASGSANGAKFKLMNDITIDASKANSGVFSNATFDGNGYKITQDMDLSQEEDIRAGATILISSVTASRYTYTPGYFAPSAGGLNNVIYGLSLGGIVSDHVQKSNVKGSSECEEKFTVGSTTIIAGGNSVGMFAGMTAGFAIGGAFGIIDSATVENVWVVVSDAVSVQQGQSCQWYMLGGLAGAAFNSTVKNCLVDYGSSGSLNFSSGEKAKLNIGSLIGYTKGGTVETSLVLSNNFSAEIVGGNSGTTVSNCHTFSSKASNIHNKWGPLDEPDGFKGNVAYGTDESGWQNKPWFMDFYDKSINSGKPIQTCYVNKGTSSGSTVTTYYTVTAKIQGNGAEMSNADGWTLAADKKSATRSVAAGTTLFITTEFPTIIITSEHYTYGGWYLNGNAKQTYVTIQSNKVVRYVAERVKYSIFLYEGESHMGTVSYTYEDTVTIPTYTGNGYTYASYWTCYEIVSSASTWTANATYNCGKQYTSQYGTVRMRITKTPIQYTITLDLNGGTISSYNPRNVTFNSSSNTITYTIENSFSLPGKNQVKNTDSTKALSEWTVQSNSGNWNMSSKGEGSQVSRLYGNVTLVAKWGSGDRLRLKLDDGATLSESYVSLVDGKTNEAAFNEEDDLVIFYGSSCTFNLPTILESVVEGENLILDYWSKWEAATNSTWTGSSYEAGYEVSGMSGNAVLKPVWKETSCRIEMRRGDGSTYWSDYGRSASSQDIILDYSRNGYTLTSWTIIQQLEGEECTVSGSTLTIPAFSYGEIILEANWEVVDYSIEYHSIMQTDTFPEDKTNPTSYKITDNDIELLNPSREGYEFIGWEGTDLSSASLEVVIAKGSYGDRSYTATWSANTDTPYVVYHYKEKLNITNPNTATSSHWDLANTENLTGTTDTEVTPDLNTYTGFTKLQEAQKVVIKGNGSTVVSYYYKRNSYELTVSANGGSFSTTTGWALSSNSTIATKTFDYDENYSFPSVSRSNYTFAKWATATSGGSTVTADTKMGNADATIYAQWNANVLTVNYHLNGGTDVGSEGTFTNGDPCKSEEYKYGDVVNSQYGLTNPNSNPVRVTRTGYTVDSQYWNTLSNGDGVNIDADCKTYSIGAKTNYTDLLELTKVSLASGNATLDLYMIWTADKFIIAFDKNAESATGSTASVEATYDAPIKLTSNGFVRSGYDYKGWAISATGEKVHDDGATLEASQVNKYYVDAGSKAGGTYTLYANWTPVTYTITFVPNGGAIRNYTPGKATGLGEFNTKNNTITYTIESVFDLPNRSQVFLLGYTTTYWEVVKVSGVRAQDGGNAWVKDSKLTTDDNNKTAYKVSKMVGNVELKAHWEENKYNINLNANNGSYSSTVVKDIGYTNVVTLTDTSSGRKIVVEGTMGQSVAVDWSLSYDKHKFVGWAVILPTGSDLYNGAPNYKYIYANEHNGGIVGTGIEKSLEENLSQNWGTKIIKDGNTVQSITLGDYEGTQTVNVYAIWTPIYTITLNAGIPEDVLKNTTDAGIFTNGTRLMSGNNPITAITKNNNYFEQYLLYAQNKTDVFITPEGNEKFFYYGYYIKGWKIMIGGTYYKYEDNSTGSTPIDKWSNKGTINDRVLSGTNMQYLQGDISATAVWEALTFDVRFQTKSTESYKQSYKDEGDKITAVTFNNPYEINENDSVANRVLATNILGYLPIYAHPHKEVNKQTVIDTTLKIAKIGAWNYRLDYIQYSKANYASTDKTKDVDWFIVVEGYYSPDLYRLELNLQLPYTDDNNFKLNQTDYVLEEESVANLQSRYEPLIISGSEYVADENYANRQGKVYKDGDKYYIYLLQDQIVENERVYARYDDGKEIENATTYAGKLLPTFEIDYYQMQYYYTLNNSAEVNMYPVCGIDEGEYSQGAKEALGVSNKEDKEIKKPDWKYSYCNVNYEDYPQDYKLNVYWYRNIINVDIINVLENHHSINGYTLITETEQVTKDKGVFKLKDHKKYHLVIYTLNDSNIYEYATYAFDSLNLLKNVKYEYAKIINLFEIMSVADLANEGIIKASTNSFPIYFGNSVKVEAVDQREDDSLDVFIGYRFNEYKYQIASETCTLLVEYDNYSNDPNNAIGSYAIDVNLQNYEHGKNGNTTNYFADKDKVSIQTHFDKIKYVFNYKVTDENYVEMPYGSIRFNYSATQIQKNHFSYTVTVDSEQWLKSRIQIRLGSELVRWDLRNSKSTATSTLTEDYIYSFATNEMPRVQIDGQTVQFVVDASFLRTHLYELDSNGKPYQTNAEQVFGDINAICKDIMFDIAVRVDDLSNGEKIREYRLADEGLTNALFTMDVNKVSIDNTYVLNMLSKQDGDEYVYYYQNGVKYVIRKLYIQGKSRNILETEFVYPSQNLGTISMNVSHELLDGCINYSQFTQVDLDNRLITFCVEVAPTYVLTFKISNNEYDIFKGDRQLLLGDTLIAQGKETVDENGNKDNIASELKFTNNSSTMEYLGYWGQQALFVFNANKTHYRAVKLTDKNGELYVGVNGNSRYSITDITEVIIELIPKTYQIDAYVVYQDVEYNTIDEAVNGRKAITELVNASGIQIFAERGIEITVDSNNASSTTGVFYPGDKIYVKHTLNSAVAKDFNVSLYNNGVGPDNYVAGKGFEIQFGGENIVLKIAVTPKIEAVTITSNMPEYAFGEIYVQVNDQDAVKVEGEAILTLINGDQLTIYTKEDIAYEFLNQYTYTEDNTKHNVTTTKASGEYDGFDTFNLFEGAGFSTDKNGIYVLAFRQIPIDIEFKYYEIIPQVEEVQAGSNYTAVSDTSIIHEGTIITLTQGIDTEGYRFVDYSYGASSGEARKELALTDLGNSQYEFTMDRPLLEYIDAQSKLSSGELEEGQLAPNLKFVIYINFIKQYKYELEDISEESYVVYKVADINGNDLLEGQYYDYGTQFNIIAQTADIEHYRIEATITNSGGVEEITSINRPLDLTEVKETNRLNLSGFTILKTFDSDYTILLKAIAEEYHTTLKQSLYLGEANVQYQEIELNDGTTTKIDVNDTIYYEIDATYLYGSLVTINVYVMNSPTEGFDDNQYYVLDLGQLKINGNDSILTVNEQQKTIDEKQYTMYQLTYNLSGHLTENADPAELEIVFNAMYYIKIV